MEKNKIYEVYKITNLVNGKVYIGITNQGHRKRWHKHCSDSYIRPSYPIHFAISKYGVENFKIEVLEILENVKELKQREIYWIDFYNSFKSKFGYNATKGGDGAFGRIVSETTRKRISDAAKKNAGKVLVYFEDTDNIKEFDTIEETANFLGLKVSGVRDRIYRKTLVKGTYIVVEKIKKDIKVRARKGFAQSEETKKKIAESNKKRWTEEKKLEAKENSSRNKRVLQYSLENIFIKEYPSTAEAARELNIQRENISKCLHGLRNKAGNYKWKFKSSN